MPELNIHHLTLNSFWVQSAPKYFGFSNLEYFKDVTVIVLCKVSAPLWM